MNLKKRHLLQGPSPQVCTKLEAYLAADRSAEREKRFALSGGLGCIGGFVVFFLVAAFLNIAVPLSRIWGTPAAIVIGLVTWGLLQLNLSGGLRKNDVNEAKVRMALDLLKGLQTMDGGVQEPRLMINLAYFPDNSFSKWMTVDLEVQGVRLSCRVGSKIRTSKTEIGQRGTEGALTTLYRYDILRQDTLKLVFQGRQEILDSIDIPPVNDSSGRRVRYVRR